MTPEVEKTLAATFRDEWPRLVAAAARVVGDLGAAEDVVQETLVSALDRWPVSGVPERPGAWLMTACRNRALNVVRDAQRQRQNVTRIRPLLPEGQLGRPGDDSGAIADDRLRLITMCCHPLLPGEAQIALTLRMVAGLTTEEIARGFHAPVATIQQRIVRAKRVLAKHRITFASDEADLTSRLSAVVDVVYLIFNEGYLPTAGDSPTRSELAAEAHRLSVLLTDLAPGTAEVWALRALLSFQLSRWSARTDGAGGLATLDVQDRRRWDQALIRDGLAALARARADGDPGPLVLQAELAACHATAPSFEATDWPRIVALYDELLAMQPTAVDALNGAVALAMASGPAAALPVLDQLVDDPALSRSHRVWSVRADLHRRLGEQAAALADYDRALELVTNDAERRYLTGARRTAAAR